VSHLAVNDPVPHNRSRLGYWLGFVFHPFTVFIPALLVVLKGTDPAVAVGWIVFIAVIIVVPALILLQLARQQGRYAYQRGTRHPIYVVFWVSMVVCVGLAQGLNAPSRLAFSLLTLCIWAPLQYLVNAWLTKISAHVGVVSGILTTLLVMGDMDHPLLVMGAGGIILATAWARVVTGHHTRLQVGLGALVGVLSVLAAFGIRAAF
jgi:hypothetical protein